jgi:hypothetical protein
VFRGYGMQVSISMFPPDSDDEGCPDILRMGIVVGNESNAIEDVVRYPHFLSRTEGNAALSAQLDQ